MKSLTLLARGLALAALVAAAPVHARSEYRGVTSVVFEAVHGALERRVDDPQQVATIVQEVNAVRRRSWSSFEGRLGACAVRLSLHGARGRIGVLIVQGDTLIELGASRTSGYQREMGSFEAQLTRRLAARIRKPTDCR